MSREEFLRGLWSYWLVVGIAWRRVRKGADREKTTLILQHLWQEQHRIPERALFVGSSGVTYDALWLERKALRSLLYLPADRFPDDDAVNVFYEGQQFYDRTTRYARSEKVRIWQLRGRENVAAKIPPALRTYATTTLGLDLEALPFPGVYLSGYDDATIWIGYRRQGFSADVVGLSPGERVRVFRHEQVESASAEHMLLEPLLEEALRRATTPVDHDATRTLVMQAVAAKAFPARLRPIALAYLLFFHTAVIMATVPVIKDLLDDDWGLLHHLFSVHEKVDVLRAREALVSLFVGLAKHSHVAAAEAVLLHAPTRLFDAELLLRMLKLIAIPHGDDRLFDLVQTRLRTATGFDKLMQYEVNQVIALREVIPNGTAAEAGQSRSERSLNENGEKHARTPHRRPRVRRG